VQNLNTVALIGNLTRDPELRYTPSGTAVTTLRIAVNDRVKRGGEWGDAAYFFDCVVWGKQAESCSEYLAKGRKVGVQGKLTWREWEARDGSKRQSVEIVADRVEFLTPRGEDGSRMSDSSDYGYAPPDDGDFGVPGQREAQSEPEPEQGDAGDTEPAPLGAGDFSPAHDPDSDIPF
jgi:single-strand DNA-binding protein